MKRLMAVLLGVACLHRLLLFGTRQLWIDELLQARIVRSGSLAEMLARLRDGMDLGAPLDYFVQKGMTLLLGESTWALRLHAVIFGTLAIWLFWRIAQFLFGDRVATYAAVLFAFYPLAYDYSQEASPYALVLLLTLLSFDLLLRQVHGKARPLRGWLLIGGVLTLLLYTSVLGGLIILAQLACLALSALWQKRPAAMIPEEDQEKVPIELSPARWPQVAFYAIAALCACGLFYPWLSFAWVRPLLAPVSEIADPKLILRLIKEMGGNSYPLAGLLLIGLATGVRALVRHGRQNSLLWLLTWFLLPIPVLLLAEAWGGYFFSIRQVLHASPPLLLIAGYGLSYVGERLTILLHLPYQLSSPAIFYAALLVVMSVYVTYSHAFNEPADWRGTASFLGKSVREGDAVTVPKVWPLIEYYVPGLEPFRTGDLDPGPGSLAYAGVKRRIVVCYDRMKPDPCLGFRPGAVKDPAWGKVQFKALTLFVRTK